MLAEGSGCDGHDKFYNKLSRARVGREGEDRGGEGLAALMCAISYPAFQAAQSLDIRQHRTAEMIELAQV